MLSSWNKGAAAIVALFALSVVPAAVYKFMPPADAKMRRDVLTIETAGGGKHAFDVELASTDQEKSVGLMYRTKLGDGEGMLFWYPDNRPIAMWMRNTYIPLDMVFISLDGTIARIEVKAEPLSDRIIASGHPVAAVLEIPGGASERLGIKPGDKVKYSLFDPRRAP